MRPLVSAIILGFNHKFCFYECLSSIFTQDYPLIEVIYVDNASSDGSSRFVSKTFPTIKIIQNPDNYGFAKGNNIGIQHAQGEFIFILNPDTTLAPDCISRLVDYMAAMPDVGIGMPKLLHQDRPEIINSVGMTYDRKGRQYHIGDGEIDKGQYATVREILLVAGACMFCRKEMLDAIGGFDESYFAYYEDAELSLRAWWHGWRCVSVPSAVIYHLRNAAAKKSHSYQQKARYFAQRNQNWPLLTFMPLPFLMRRLPALICKDIYIIARGLLRLAKYRQMPVELLAKRDSIAAITRLLARRRSLKPFSSNRYQKLAELLR